MRFFTKKNDSKKETATKRQKGGYNAKKAYYEKSVYSTQLKFAKPFFKKKLCSELANLKTSRKANQLF